MSPLRPPDKNAQAFPLDWPKSTASFLHQAAVPVTMPSKSAGRIAKVRKSKNATPHQKNHRWESFSAKISKFNSLQPLRKVRRHDLDNEDLSATTSYFCSGLQKWSELNISKVFVAFKQEVRPLSESLPQILHFESRIMELLAKHISTQDKEALEPLLDLLTAFAHDLGIRFEKFYSQSLELLLAIAGGPQPVEVIEWTFGALAFLFKYLSKLLAPDLRATYDVLSPLLGKRRHPQYIARFAAEAMSFLVKKAAAPSHRETALPLFTKHVRDDLFGMTDDRQFTLYKDGVMSLFAEAIKGTDRTIHSSGDAILADLICEIPASDGKLSQQNVWCDCVCGILTSIVHHASTETFADLEDTVLDALQSRIEGSEEASEFSLACLRILAVLAGTRKGSRISNWPKLVKLLVQVLTGPAKVSIAEMDVDSSIALDHLLFHVTTIWNHASMDALVSHISPLMHVLTREPFMPLYISFCACFGEVNPGRFRSLILKDFHK